MGIRPGAIIERLWPLAVIVRMVAIGVLLIGPWTDESAELSGWDVERFQEIAGRAEAAWVDVPVEYPPGSVVIFDAIAGSTVVETNRRLILLAASFEVATTVALWRRVGPRAGKAFLLLGLPLVPMGLLRLDLVVTAIATFAALLLLTIDRPAEPKRRASVHPGARLATLGFGVLVAIGAMIKIWPGLLLAPALARRRFGSVFAGFSLAGAAGFGWLLLVGNGLEPLDQVLSLRGATGWHVESLPGSLVALMGSDEPRLELNAYRIGTINQLLVFGGRVLALVAIGALALVRNRGDGSDTERLALVMLGSTSALIATAPLLSPQFLLWLTPWGAMLMAGQKDRVSGTMLRILATLSGATIVTGLVLAGFGPPNLANGLPALLLVLRNGCLLALPILCFQGLTEQPDPVRQASLTVE